MKNLALFNLSLLSKWRWRLLVDKEALWCKVFKAKYRVEVSVNPNLTSVGSARIRSCVGWGLGGVKR